MGANHHSHDSTPMNDDQKALLDRLISEIKGTANREWPQGRVSGDDDGVTAFAIAADRDNKIVRIQFTKPMFWLGLDNKSARDLAAKLIEKAEDLERNCILGA